jgi:hypothetical protein
MPHIFTENRNGKKPQSCAAVRTGTAIPSPKSYRYRLSNRKMLILGYDPSAYRYWIIITGTTTIGTTGIRTFNLYNQLHWAYNYRYWYRVKASRLRYQYRYGRCYSTGVQLYRPWEYSAESSTQSFGPSITCRRCPFHQTKR